MSSHLAFARSFVRRGPPYVGDCSFSDKSTIKANGGKWNVDCKKWEARTDEDLEKLLKCGLWLPLGVTRQGADFILAALDEDRRAADLSLNSFLFDRRNPSVSEFDREKDTMTVNGHTKVTKTGSKPTSPPRFPACASLCAGVRNTLPNVQRVAGL